MSDTPMIDSFVKDSKLEDGDYLGLYLQAQRIERELNEAYYIISELNELEPKNRDYDVWDRADAWSKKQEMTEEQIRKDKEKVEAFTSQYGDDITVNNRTFKKRFRAASNAYQRLKALKEKGSYDH